MKSYFIQLLNYDHYANKQMNELMLVWPGVNKPVAIMSHLLAAQQRWLCRCKLQPAPASSLWPDWPAADLAGIIDTLHAEWVTYLDSLQPGNFEHIISYTTTTGENFSDKLTDIMAHLINHGTHHRAQIGQHLKLAGASLPATDYIFYLRQLN